MAKKGNDFENPLLNDEVDVKDYGKLNMDLSEEQKNSPIPEPRFTPPPFQFEGEETAQAQQSGGTSKEASGSFNESLEGASDKERKEQAKQLATVVVGVYEYLHKFPNDWSKISEKRAKDLHSKGEINLNAVIPNGSGLTIKDFIDQFNKESDGVFYVSQEFKDNVIPLLTRILQKNGVGLTDEEMLAYFVVMDLVQKGQLFFSLMESRKETLAELKEISKGIRNNPTPSPNAAPKAAESPLQDGTVENVRTDGSVEIVEIEDVTPKKNGRGRKPKPKAE